MKVEWMGEEEEEEDKYTFDPASSILPPAVDPSLQRYWESNNQTNSLVGN